MKRVLIVYALLLCAAASCAYPGETRVLSSKALEEYNAGEYAKAEELYSKAVEKSDNPASKYNLGTTQLMNKKRSEAMETLKNVYDVDHAGINALARYNSGRAHHDTAHELLKGQQHLAQSAGQSAPQQQAGQPLEGAIKELETAIQEYRAAILNAPQDEDMKFNFELAKRELEQLRQQQQQQQRQQHQQHQQNQQDQKQQQQDQQNQNQEQQQQQKQQDQQKQEQQKQQEKQQQQQEQQQQQQEQKEQQEQRQQQDPQNQNKQQQQQQQQPQEGQSGDSQQEQQPTPGEMTPQDVARLLNTLPPENREALQQFYNAQFRSRQDMENDW